MRAAFGAVLLLLGAPALAQHSGQHGEATAAAQPEHASAEEQAAVLSTVNRLFAALAARNPEALLAEVVPEGRATSAYTNAAGVRGVNSQAWTAWAPSLAQGTSRLSERLIDPHVHVEGDIAMIWSRYEFEIDGRFSHCGVDHFDLVRQDGRWRVLNLTWTQQRENCPGR